MEAVIGGYILSGGATGIAIGVLYFIYKFCEKRRFHSECCGGSIDIKNESTPSPKDTKREIIKT